MMTLSERLPVVPCALSARDLRAGYAENIALYGIDCAIQRGRTTALIGPGGSGKSTLVRIIARANYQLPAGMWISGQLSEPDTSLRMLAQLTTPHQDSLAAMLGRECLSGRSVTDWLYWFWSDAATPAAKILSAVA
ncbi:MAG: ATP-binding cassette domain-containing protein, partial [Myxococcota bacterium]